MANIKIEVRSGGIVLKRKDKWNLAMDLSPMGEKQGILLTRPQSLMGVLSFLVGITERLDKVEKERPDVFAKLKSWVGKFKIVPVGTTINLLDSGFTTTFFERKDIHSSTSGFSANPSVLLKNYTLADADATLVLFGKTLMELYGTDNLGALHEIILKASNGNKEKHMVSSVGVPSISNYPEGNLKEKIKEYLTKIREEENDREYSQKFNAELIKIIAHTDGLLSTDPDLRERFKTATANKFSVFTTSLKQERQWLKASSTTFVRGGPQVLACCDFDLYLFEPDDELLEYLKSGPGSATWAEGGCAVLKISEDGSAPILSPSDYVEEIFISIKQIRVQNPGFKIKKYDWEKEIEVVDEDGGEIATDE
jgi:hypothetical protein